MSKLQIAWVRLLNNLKEPRMTLNRTGWFGLKNLVLKALGHENFQAAIYQTGIRIVGATQFDIGFHTFKNIEVEDELFGLSKLTISDRVSGTVELVGFAKDEAHQFASKANVTYLKRMRALFDAHGVDINHLALALTELKLAERYPAANVCEPLLERARRLYGVLSLDFPDNLLTAEEMRDIEAINRFLRSPGKFRRNLIREFNFAELQRSEHLLDKLEKNPLTLEQRTAVVTDEDATLVLASAGSGKTSVIMAKVAHLISRGLCSADQVMMLSFAKEAAKEITSRVKTRTNLPIAASTFHSLGSEIIKNVEGRRRRLAEHATNSTKKELLIKEIVDDLISTDPRFSALLRTWFSDFLVPYKSLWDFKTLSEYIHYIRKYELRSLKGDRVRSFEECEIANWLFLNGVEYKYEEKYEHNVSAPDRRAYQPDFFLVKSGAYIEHFGLSRRYDANGEVEYQTAPYIDREKYLSDRKWKLSVHEKHGTKLIETFSYEKSEGRLIEVLRERVIEVGETLQPVSTHDMFEHLRSRGSIDRFAKILSIFLSQFKGNQLKCADLLSNVKGKSAIERNSAFIQIFSPVHQRYQESLGELVDFDDMISIATRYVKEGKYRSRFRYLLVDEFQDISRGRVLLLKALLSSNRGSKIFAVGDDWQSIYRFAGSDVAVMKNFGELFGGTFNQRTDVHKVVDLGRTFRCVDKVALPATEFVIQNQNQLRKTVEPAGKAASTAIRVSYSSDHSDDHFALLRALKKLDQGAEEKNELASVIVLARFGKYKPDVKLLGTDFSSLSIETHTVHGSKGLEADHIIVMAMNSGQYGFPSEISDDPVLDMVLPDGEDFAHAEERRLFYVALTRARKTVDLIARADEPSSFVQELVEDCRYDVEVIGDPPSAPGKCIRCGGRVIRQFTKAGKLRYKCENAPYCNYSAPPCPQCNNDTPARHSAYASKAVCSCEARFPLCSKCGDGWMLVRKGKYSDFLGCSNYPDCDSKRTK